MFSVMSGMLTQIFFEQMKVIYLILYMQGKRSTCDKLTQVAMP